MSEYNPNDQGLPSDFEIDFDPTALDLTLSTPLPWGNYWGEIQKAEMKMKPGGLAPYIALRLNFQHPDETDENRPRHIAFENVSLSPKASFRVSQLYAALYGREEAGRKRLNVLELVGRTVAARLGQELDNKSQVRNNVIRFLPLDEDFTEGPDPEQPPALGGAAVPLPGTEVAPGTLPGGPTAFPALPPLEAADPNQGWGAYTPPTATPLPVPVTDFPPVPTTAQHTAQPRAVRPPPAPAPTRSAPVRPAPARPAPAARAPAKSAKPPAKPPAKPAKRR